MGRRKPVSKIHLGQVPYGFIGRFQAFSAKGKTAEDLAQEMFDAFRAHKQTQVRMADILIELFVRSATFAQAKLRIGYLEGLGIWDPLYADKLNHAVDENDQISDAHGVPVCVVRLIKKWQRKRPRS